MSSTDRKQLPPRTPDQQDHDAQVILRYGKGPYAIADMYQKLRHMVYEAAEIEQLYAAGRYDECRQMCHEVLQAETGLEAVQAKCHMYLAGQNVGAEDAALRA